MGELLQLYEADWLTAGGHGGHTGAQIEGGQRTAPSARKAWKPDKQPDAGVVLATAAASSSSLKK